MANQPVGKTEAKRQIYQILRSLGMKDIVAYRLAGISETTAANTKHTKLTDEQRLKLIDGIMIAAMVNPSLKIETRMIIWWLEKRELLGDVKAHNR